MWSWFVSSNRQAPALIGRASLTRRATDGARAELRIDAGGDGGTADAEAAELPGAAAAAAATGLAARARRAAGLRNTAALTEERGFFADDAACTAIQRVVESTGATIVAARDSLTAFVALAASQRSTVTGSAAVAG